MMLMQTKTRSNICKNYNTFRSCTDLTTEKCIATTKKVMPYCSKRISSTLPEVVSKSTVEEPGYKFTVCVLNGIIKEVGKNRDDVDRCMKSGGNR